MSEGSGVASWDLSKAAETRLWPFSPDEVGAMAGVISFSESMCVGTWVKSVRLFQILMPTLSAWAVARNSPVSEKARAVQGLSSRRALMRWPVGRSHTRMTESIEAAMIQRPSFEKQKLLIWPRYPQSSRTSFFVSVSITRIERSSQLNAIRSFCL